MYISTNYTLSIMCVQLKLLTSGFYRLVEIFVSKDMIFVVGNISFFFASFIDMNI